MAMALAAYERLRRGDNREGTVLALRVKGDILPTSRFVLKKHVPQGEFIAVAASMSWDDALTHEAWSASTQAYAWQLPGTWNSAFSPEDLPSDIVGADLARDCLIRSGGNTKMISAELTVALAQTLKEAGAISKRDAEKVWDEFVRDKWAKPPKDQLFGLTVELLKRNTDGWPWKIPADVVKSIPGAGICPTWFGQPTSKRKYYHVQQRQGVSGQTFETIDLDASMAEIRGRLRRLYGDAHFSP
jgi:hypothetical protein